MATPAIVQRASKLHTDRIFFPVMSLVILVVVLIGFARTYFLAGMVRAPLPNWMVHVHGAVFTAWIVLLIVQTGLIVTRNVRVHRTLGMAGFGLAAGMVVMGIVAATDALHRGSSPPGSGLDPRTFYARPIFAMLIFSVLVAWSYRARFQPMAHKRLILIATISLLDAALARWPFGFMHPGPVPADLVYFAILLLPLLYDLAVVRKFQPVTAAAIAYVAVIHLASVPIGMTPLWHRFAALMGG